MPDGITRTSVTMPDGLYNRIRLIAQNENRKTAPQIITLLSEALDARDKKEGRK